MDDARNWSRLQGFFALDTKKRREVLASLPALLTDTDFSELDRGLSLSLADQISENVVGTFSLPLSIAANFVVDNEAVLVPMVTEEPSIVAACTKLAKLVSLTGGFHTQIDRALIKGQIQLYDLPDIDQVTELFECSRSCLLRYAKEQCPAMEARGGGVIDIGMRVLASDKIGPMVLIEPVIDVVDAMGANAVNTVLEGLAHKVREIFPGKIGLKILSNLCDRRLARARCHLPFRALASDEHGDNGPQIAQKMIAAHALAEADVYRACTHNKGILNGIDAVAIATGNDFRAIEAGAHAFAAIKGSYAPLTAIHLDNERQILVAELTLPLAVGVVGGISHIHEGVKFSRKILGPFATTSKKLSSVLVSVGLSQCLAALLALVQDGIQKGHMKLHKKKLAFDAKTNVGLSKW